MIDAFLRQSHAVYAPVLQVQQRGGGAAFAGRLFRFLIIVILLDILASSRILVGQADASTLGTAFTYQGQLFDMGQPAHGNFDMTFSLFNASQSGSQVGNTLTNLDTSVTNGLFTVQLDFGPVFNGNALWLQIGVRTNGAASFTSLSPLQPLTPTPYAITASNALTATTVTGSVSGNGGGLTNLNASQITAGTINESFLPSSSVLTNGASAPGQVPMWNGSGYVWASAGNVYSNTVVTFNTINITNATGTNNFAGPLAVSNGITLWGISNTFYGNHYTIGQDSALLGSGGGVWSPFPVPFFSPASSNQSGMAFDIMTTGNLHSNGIPAWIDVCDEDIRMDSNDWNVATLRCDPVNGYVNVGEKAYGAATNSPLPTVIAAIDGNGMGGNVGINHSPDDWFSVINSSTNAAGATIENTASGKFAYTRFAVRNTESDTANGVQIDSFSPGYTRQNIYQPDSVVVQANSEMTNGLYLVTASPAAHIKLYAGGINITSNEVMDAQSNLVTFTAPISAPVNKASFGTESAPITLGSTFTNLTGARADFVGQFQFDDSESGNPTLVISNLTTGLVITNSAQVSAGQALQSIILPDVSPNDVCEAYDASSTPGASVSLIQAWWIVK